jgi:hypothetical protein
MTNEPPQDSNSEGPRRSSGGRASTPSLTWRQRYESARAKGVALDPVSEPVPGIEAYPTAYDPDHLLVTDAGRLGEILGLLQDAASDFGWSISLRNLDGTPLEVETAAEREERNRLEFDIPTIHRIDVFRDPKPGRDDAPVPPIDSWRLLQRARARTTEDATRRRLLESVGLDHVLSVDPVGGKTNPVGGKTNPVGGKTNPVGGKTNIPGTDSYLEPGAGGRQVVDYVGPAPTRTLPLAAAGRRPVVAILDTGCGRHSWLGDDVVTRYPVVDDRVLGLSDLDTDPELVGDVSGPYDGVIDDAAGHGTFIAGIIRQVSPEADIVAVRVADSQGTLLEGDFMMAVRGLVKMIQLPAGRGGRQIDVINLSVGYYHETPQDALFDRTLSALLVAARRRGCAVVCSAGNDATDRPAFPAALWRWPGADFTVTDPRDAAPHVSVGALNPNGTMALFSNLGPWVRTYAPGAAVLSAFPHLNGGVQPGSRDDRNGFRRETIDPDDFTGGYALWSGTSFAAPYVAGRLAATIAAALMAGELTTGAERARALRDAERKSRTALSKLGPALA